MKILILKKHLRHDLPEYRSYEELRNKIVTAIEGSCGFDGVDLKPTQGGKCFKFWHFFKF